MGIEMRPRNIKLGEKAEKQLCELQDALHPFCVNRSSTIRTVVDLMHKIIFTPGIVEKLGLLLQGVPCTYFVHTNQRVLSPEKQKPGPMRAETEANSRRAGAANSTTYRLATKAGAVVQFRRKDRTDHAWRITSSLAGVGGMLA